MACLKGVALKGARIVWAHTLLNRYVGFSLLSPEVDDRFGGDWSARNDAFEDMGRIPAMIDEDALADATRTAWEQMG